MMEPFLNFCTKMDSVDFYDENNLENFKNVGGCELLKEFLQVGHHEIQMASLQLLERFTKKEKYAEYFYEICPEIMGFLQEKCVKITGTGEETERSVIALMVLKNMSRCEAVKAQFDTDRYLGTIYATFQACMRMLARKRPADPEHNIAFFCAGVMIEIMSNASDRDACKLRISLGQVSRQLTPFIQNPMFLNDVIFLSKNLSALESERVVLLEQRILVYVQDLLQHDARFKDFYPCTMLVRNLLKCPQFADFASPGDMIAILTGLVRHSNRYGVYKSDEDQCVAFIECLQLFVHKFKDEECVYFLKELRVVEHLMRNLSGVLRNYSRHGDCCPEKKIESQNRINIRVDILEHLAEHAELREQFKTLSPFVKLLPGEIDLCTSTFTKVLHIMQILGAEVLFRQDFYDLLDHFWQIYSNQQQIPEIRMAAAYRISEVYTLRTDCLWSCLKDVTLELYPMRKSRNELILEGFCQILNAIFRNIANVQPDFNVAEHEEIHWDREVKYLQGSRRSLCDHCQLLAWMFNILRRLNKDKNIDKISSSFLGKLTEFFSIVSAPPDVGNFLVRNNIVGLMTPLVVHSDTTVHSTVLEILNHLTTLKDFQAVSTADKMALFKALGRLREDNKGKERLQERIGEIARRLVKVRPLLTYTKEPARASKDVKLKVFKLNRWVR